MSSKIEIKYSELVRHAMMGACLKLHPREEIKNPVMFVVWIGAILSAAFLLHRFSGFNLQITLWL